MSSDNCYAYATNGYGHLQPGDGKNNLSCGSLIRNVVQDGHIQIDCDSKCEPSEHKIMAFIASRYDFHFYRQEKMEHGVRNLVTMIQQHLMHLKMS